MSEPIVVADETKQVSCEPFNRDAMTVPGLRPVMTMNGLHHRLVRKRTGDEYHVLVDDLCLPKNAFVAILGSNGCGKTTLLTLDGLVREPTEIDAFHLYENGPEDEPLDLKKLWRKKPRAITDLRRRTIGFCPQGFELIPTLTAFENIEMPLRLNGWSQRSARERAKKLLMDFGGDESDIKIGHKLMRDLSGGQQQRVAVARAAAAEPAILFVDEPTSALDPVRSSQALKLLKELQEREKSTVVMISHDHGLTRNFAEFVIHMDCPSKEERPDKWQGLEGGVGLIAKFERRIDGQFVETDSQWKPIETTDPRKPR